MSGVRPLLLDLLDDVASGRRRLTRLQTEIINRATEGDHPYAFGYAWGIKEFQDLERVDVLMQEVWTLLKRVQTPALRGSIYDVDRSTTG